MIAALYRHDDSWALYTEVTLRHINGFIEKYNPLTVIQVEDIRETLKSNPNPELVVLKADESLIWLYSIENKPAKWTWQELYDIVRMGKIVPARLPDGKPLPFIDIRDESEKARKLFSEWMDVELKRETLD